MLLVPFPGSGMCESCINLLCPRCRDKEQEQPELTWGRVTCDAGGKKEAPTQAPTLSVSLNTDPDHAMSDSHRRSQPGDQASRSFR